LVVGPIAPFAVFSSLVGFLTLPKSGRERVAALSLAGLAALGTTVGMIRFVTGPALQGIVEAGTRAAGQRAVSRLREIVFAEDGMRRMAAIDGDGDGVGSAALLGELSGATPLRTGGTLGVPVLSREYRPTVETASGPAAAIQGYLYQVCLPQADGGFSAVPGALVDEESAERRFLAYAWPESAADRLSRVYFIDEHERILVSSNRGDDGGLLYVGARRTPSCLRAELDARFRPWRDKKPRRDLPGDPSSTK
jgi:hypothetical protein